jgi:hypothetical protein
MFKSKITKQIIIALVFVLVLSAGTTALAATIENWAKIEDVSSPPVTITLPNNFILIKQATVAAVWLESDLTDAEKADLRAQIESKDSAIKSDTGVYFT